MTEKSVRPSNEAATESKPARRRFLGTAATGAAGAAALATPMISVAQSPVVMKMQGAWGANDIFTEMAQQYVTRVNEMAGGRLRLEYLPAGAVVKPFELMDAVSKGVLDAGHHVSGYWYGKSKVASLFGTGPVSGATPEIGLTWIYQGGGQQLWDKLVAKLNLNVVGFFAFPMPSQPLGWFKNPPPKTAAALKGFKYRTIGLAADMLQEMGMAVAQLPGGEIVPAMQRGVIDAFEFNNPTSDMRFGAQDVAKYYSMGSYHQAQEFFEIIFNKDKYNALAPELKAILKYAAEATSLANTSLAHDSYSKDLQELIVKHKVQVSRTPQDVYKGQLAAWDKVTAKLEKEVDMFKEVNDSFKAWSRRVGFYHFTNEADYKMAFEHVQKIKLPT
ncbi:TRAP transporter substrate-binding protein [Burkholderiaceae bacterium FT117]|uniref:TRAP transporter substrate-binding protein n=1 Tax=Zeimonas sediminis TaxID=2944268 RepID=UPI002342E27E|nr:TRAP transporter substrate-binding protein [Zeimonas sediminis]MCM5571324.1 TRAP transporter substrate-binding protein [Zeimonas sediminis]